MILADDIAEIGVVLKDQYFDIKGLSAYSAMAISTLRDYIRSGHLPCYKLKGKILVKRSVFDDMMERFRFDKKRDLNGIVDEVMGNLKNQ